MKVTEKEKMAKLEKELGTGEIDGSLSMKAEASAGYKTITDSNGLIVDYQNVKIAGYASRWGKDRDDESMVKNAFADSLKEFKANPILCLQHDSRSENAGVGKATVLFEDEKGLVLEGELSNAPGLKDLRFKVCEGIIKGLSVAGRFVMEFKKNEILIHKVSLREISLCITPAAAKALFTVKSESPEPPENMASAGADDDVVKIEIDGVEYKITD